MTALTETAKIEPVRRGINKRPKTILKKARISRRKIPVKSKSEPKPQLKFAGPVKILIIEPKSQYCKGLWLAVAVGFTHLCVGAINFTILHYSFVNKDIHAALCSFAFHFFTAEAILCLHYSNGWSTPMRLRHRKGAHMYMQLGGYICAIAGTLLIFLNKGVGLTLHGISGIIAVVLAGIGIFIGLGVYLTRKKWFIICHMTFGMLSFIAASLSLCSGLFYQAFLDFGGEIVFILLGIVIFVVVFIVLSTFLKCVTQL